MAEIKVQEKRGGHVWLWVIAVIIVALILWYIFGNRGATVPPATTTTGSVVPASAPMLALVPGAIATIGGTTIRI